MRKPILHCIVHSTLIVFLLAPIADARANVMAVGADAEGPSSRRFVLDVGMMVGGSDIADVEGGGHGIHVDAGARLGPVQVLGEYDYLAVGESDVATGARRGNLGRLGLVARYSVLAIGGPRSPVATDWWVEAGGGRQRITWDGGGVLTRNDLTLGFGVQLDGRLDRDSHRPKHFGPYLAFRANLARAPELPRDPRPSCGGPCDRPTGPSRNDVSMFFHFGMHFGR